MQKSVLHLLLVMLSALLVACASDPPQDEVPPHGAIYLDSMNELKIVRSQTIYVPAYSHIYSGGRKREVDLAVTLSIRNTDLTFPIVISSVRYYDNHGKLVRAFLNKPLKLPPLASSDYFIDQDDKSGGLGANFIVEWVAEDQVHEPVVEAIMIGIAGNQSISWVSTGRILEQTR